MGIIESIIDTEVLRKLPSTLHANGAIASLRCKAAREGTQLAESGALEVHKGQLRDLQHQKRPDAFLYDLPDESLRILEII